MPFDPLLNFGMLVRAVVVHYQMHFLIDRKLLFEMIQELHEFATAVAMLTGADDFAIENVERGK